MQVVVAGTVMAGATETMVVAAVAAVAGKVMATLVAQPVVMAAAVLLMGRSS